MQCQAKQCNARRCKSRRSNAKQTDTKQSNLNQRNAKQCEGFASVTCNVLPLHVSPSTQIKAMQTFANQSESKQSNTSQAMQRKAEQSKAMQRKAEHLHSALPLQLPFALRKPPYCGRAGFIVCTLTYIIKKQ